MTQAREPHDGLRCKLLRQFHAALVGRMIGLVEIDVGQSRPNLQARIVEAGGTLIVCNA
jgi:hypothetical protein